MKPHKRLKCGLVNKVDLAWKKEHVFKRRHNTELTKSYLVYISGYIYIFFYFSGQKKNISLQV